MAATDPALNEDLYVYTCFNETATSFTIMRGSIGEKQLVGPDIEVPHPNGYEGIDAALDLYESNFFMLLKAERDEFFTNTRLIYYWGRSEGQFVGSPQNESEVSFSLKKCSLGMFDVG